MNEFAKKWIEALRSGKYKQGQQYLRNKDNTFCCLGVLCDISGKGEWEEHDSRYDYVIDNIPEDKWLPLILQQELGISGGSGMNKQSIVGQLVQLNDTGATFEQIANVLENNPQWFKED